MVCDWNTDDTDWADFRGFFSFLDKNTEGVLFYKKLIINNLQLYKSLKLL